jgi:hypothetical protein
VGGTHPRKKKKNPRNLFLTIIYYNIISYTLTKEKTMDSNSIEKNIIDSSRRFGAKNKCTMFGINLGVELNQKLTDYSKMMGVSKAAVVKQLLIAFLKER